MTRIGFTMKLLPGNESEYQARHDAIWPQLTLLLKDHGVRSYSIFLDAATLTLFGVLSTDDHQKFSELPQSPVMQAWWQFMKDIMETNADGSPISVPLKEVFYLP